MKRVTTTGFFTTALLAGTMLALPVSAQEAPSSAQATVPVMLELHPPQVEYEKLCEADELLPKPSQDFSGWDGKKSSLTAKELFLHGRLYLDGNATTPANPALAAKFFTLATKGNSKIANRSKLQMAKMLLKGKGVTQDSERAVSLMQEASRYGTRWAAYELGFYYENTGNYLKAEEYYKQSAASGNPAGLLAIATLYRENRIAPPTEDSLKTTLLLAENKLLADLAQGNCGTLYAIGAMYEQGKAFPKNPALAAEWLHASVRANDPRGMELLAELYHKGTGVNQDTDKAIALLKQAATHGESDPMYRLGFLYAYGDGIEKDRKQAIHWLTRGATLGHMDAIALLADIYEGLLGDTAEPKEAAHWLEKAAAHADAEHELIYRLGRAYETGTGVTQDYTRSYTLYERAATQGNRDAFIRMAEAFQYGRGVEQQPKKALKFLRLASNRGSTEAMRRMTEVYRCGIGVTVSEDKALTWEDRAVVNKSASAMVDQARRKAEEGTPSGWQDYHQLLTQAAKEESRKAMAMLSLAYRSGQGVEKNNDTAQQWEERALEAGDNRIEALLLLYKSYGGIGSYNQAQNNLTDTKKAAALLEEISNDTSARARYEYAKLLLSDEQLSVDETAEAIAQRKANALTILTELTQDSHMKSMLLLAKERLKVPTLTEASAVEVIHYLTQVAQNGSIEAMALLAKIYYQGHAGIPADMKQAQTWMQQAARSYPCLEDELITVAQGYLMGIGVKKDAEKALAFYERAAEMGATKAMRKLGTLFANGNNDIPRDESKGMEWFERAAEQGDVKAMVELANAYAAGYGVAPSSVKAISWWERAAAAGNKEAIRQLEQIKTTGYGTVQTP